jgi:UDP-N-acetylmuramyl tripeptide synthase
MKKYLASVFAILTKALLTRFKLGSGSALPGRVALMLDANYISKCNDLFVAASKTFFISGTNGKTTSSGILTNILELAYNKKIINNAFGANLYYGIASILAQNAFLKKEDYNNGFVFEVDEAALKSLAKDLYPKTILLTNIYRDQLDRFGEINATKDLLEQAILQLKNQNIKLILNADDTKISQFKELEKYGFQIYFYSVANVDIAFQETKTNSKLETKNLFKATLLEANLDSSLIKFCVDNQEIDLNLPIAGNYNVYNACAAAAAAYYNGVSLIDIKKGIESYKPAFGRGEKKSIAGKDLNIFLIKNPAGCTEVINFTKQFENSKILIAINDNYADGRDVSWLWDAQFENFAQLKNTQFICSGSRAFDMALRLKYAGITNVEIDSDLIPSIKMLLEKSTKDENLFVLPTYTALLEINSKLN